MNIKKKLLTLILLLCVFFPCLTLVQGCKDKDTPPESAKVSLGLVTDAIKAEDTNLKDVPVGAIMISSAEEFKEIVSHINAASRSDSHSIVVGGIKMTANDILSATYVLTKDIDFKGAEVTPIGAFYEMKSSGNPFISNETYKLFSGKFDGCGYQLKDFKLSSGYTKQTDYYSYYADMGYMLSYCTINYRSNGLFAHVGNVSIKKSLDRQVCCSIKCRWRYA